MPIHRQLIPSAGAVSGLANSLGISDEDALSLCQLDLAEHFLDRRGDERAVLYLLIGILRAEVIRRVILADPLSNRSTP